MRPRDSEGNHDAVENDGGHADASELTDKDKSGSENERANEIRAERINELLDSAEDD